MFTYISQFISNLLGTNTEENESLDDEKNFKESSLEEEDKIEVYHTNRQSFDGTITSFFNNGGLINDHIYFTKTAVVGNMQPQVGDTVTCNASRSHVEGGWVANKVHITTFWNLDDEKDTKPYKDIVIGTVTDCNKHSVSIQIVEQVTVSIRKFKSGYQPFRGDWVSVEIWRQNTDSACASDNGITEEEIISISPLREKKIHGTVTEILNGFGFIDSDIYFSFSACERGNHMRKGDAVVAMVLESKQKRGDWRAYSVALKRGKKSESPPKTLHPSKTNNFQELNGIIITENISFGTITLGDVSKYEIVVSNDSNNSKLFKSFEVLNNQVTGLSVKIGPDLKAISSSDTTRRPMEDVFQKGKILCPSMTILPGEKKVVPLEFKPVHLGKINMEILFVFDQFEITRSISANVTDKLQTNLHKEKEFVKAPSQTFFGKPVNTRLDEGFVIPGQRPVRKKKVSLPKNLARYPIPSFLRKCVLYSDGDLELMVPEITKPLHISIYKKKLTSLLCIEELQMELEMREFDMFEVNLRPAGEFLLLNVPGLAEGRPSLLLGDRVIVRHHGKGGQAPSYEGYIHEVHAEDVLLKFNQEFQQSYYNDDLDVEFYFNRTPLRRKHQAVDHALNLGDEVLFPKTIVLKEPLLSLKSRKLKFFNQSLNERQQMAVSRILNGCGRPIPYVLFGPPGTGKSVTVVESILQVFKNIKHSRILACAPSNSAADLIAERLHNSGLVKKSDMVRLNAFQRSKIPIPECIEEYCVGDTDEIKFASRYRIIISTCNMAGFLYSFDLKVGHFTHIFVDEAGQATEPECLIPVGFAAGCDEAQVVLSGDPFQLGPVLRSEMAEEYGLNLSFLERLTTSNLYERNEELYTECYNPLVVTKLINNYRSHPDLLRLSSSMFYDRELIPCADHDVVNMFTSSQLLINLNVPFIFHGLRSEDYREGNSPSWFNPMEAVQVLRYVQLILQHKKISVDDIGIITPYRKQVEKIRVLLDQFNLCDIKVGSVEEFQGQERTCIIISTVRSNEELVNADCYHNVGFLSNPKRFNVAITRAQALLVIVGNPIVLCYDPYWCAMLQYAVMSECYTGCNLPPLDHPIIQENFKKALYLLGLTSINTKHIDVISNEASTNNSAEDESNLDDILDQQTLNRHDQVKLNDISEKDNLKPKLRQQINGITKSVSTCKKSIKSPSKVAHYTLQHNVNTKEHTLPQNGNTTGGTHETNDFSNNTATDLHSKISYQKAQEKNIVKKTKTSGKSSSLSELHASSMISDTFKIDTKSSKTFHELGQNSQCNYNVNITLPHTSRKADMISTALGELKKTQRSCKRVVADSEASESLTTELPTSKKLGMDNEERSTTKTLNQNSHLSKRSNALLAAIKERKPTSEHR